MKNFYLIFALFFREPKSGGGFRDGSTLNRSSWSCHPRLGPYLLSHQLDHLEAMAQTQSSRLGTISSQILKNWDRVPVAANYLPKPRKCFEEPEKNRHGGQAVWSGLRYLWPECLPRYQKSPQISESWTNWRYSLEQAWSGKKMALNQPCFFEWILAKWIEALWSNKTTQKWLFPYD